MSDLPDAFRNPQQVRPGCQHQLGCKCVAPYWLRESTPAEEAREQWLRDGAHAYGIPSSAPSVAGTHPTEASSIEASGPAAVGAGDRRDSPARAE